MKFLLHTISFILVFAAAVVPVFAADVITKKSDGKRVSGTITAMTKTDLTLKRPQGEETFPVEEVAAIEWEGGGPDLKLGYAQETAGQYETAARSFQKAKAEAKSPSNFLQGEFDYIQARVLAKQALTDADKRDQAIQKLQAAEKSFPEHFRFYESVMLLSQLQLVAKDFEGLRPTLAILKKAPGSDLQMAATIAEAKALVAEGKLDEAIAGFESAAKSADESPAGVARHFEALLGQASGLVMQTKYDEAMKILTSIIDKGPVDDSAVQAQAYVLQGQALQGLGRNKEAALAYLHVDILYPRESNFHAESLYQMSRLWKQVQHPDRSAEAAGKLVQLYPNSEWRKKLSGSE